MSFDTDRLHGLLGSRPTPEHVAYLLVSAGLDRSIGSSGHEALKREQEEAFRERELQRRRDVLSRLAEEYPRVVTELSEYVRAKGTGVGIDEALAGVISSAGQVDGWDIGIADYHERYAFRYLPTPDRALKLIEQYELLASDEVDVPDWAIDLPPTLGELADEYVSRRSFLGSYEQFATHPGLHGPYDAAVAALEAAGLPVPAADASDAVSLRAFVDAAWQALGVDAVRQDRVRQSSSRSRRSSSAWRRSSSRGARGDRRGSVDVRSLPSAAEIRQAHPGVPVAAWRRAAKAVSHLDQRTGVLESAQGTQRVTRFGKSRLASEVTVDEMAADLPTAAFVAYYASRLSARTLFTVGSQSRPMDTIAQELFDLARASESYRPDVVARVYTAPSVLAALSAEQLGVLLGRYYEVMADAARQLEARWDPQRSRDSMVVRRGEDSSGWNMASRAFNQARTGWLNLMSVAGLSEQVSSRLPGKVPALVAGDVAFWHESEGAAQHGDIAVWAALPLPWEVLDGRAECSASDVAAACQASGVDPETSGWTQAYRQDGLEVAEVSPALVHGVQVSSDALASWLKASGVFSGYQVRLRAPRPDAGVSSPARTAP